MLFPSEKQNNDNNLFWVSRSDFQTTIQKVLIYTLPILNIQHNPLILFVRFYLPNKFL